MKHSRLIGSLVAMLSIFAAMRVHAALIGVLPATPGGADWQAYYDDQLDITWMANANVNVTNNIWDSQMAWVADAFIVQLLNFTFVGFGHGSQSSRSGKCFILCSIDTQNFGIPERADFSSASISNHPAIGNVFMHQTSQ